jgi:hypothetical protein
VQCNSNGHRLFHILASEVTDVLRNRELMKSLMGTVALFDASSIGFQLLQLMFPFSFATGLSVKAPNESWISRQVRYRTMHM